MSRSSEADVLITGASGFIGRALCRRLGQRGDLHVVALGRGDADLADPLQTRKVLEAHRPAKIVHLAAALPLGPEDAAGRQRQWRDTFLAGRNVVEGAADTGVRHLLMAGSVAELGDQGGILAPDVPAQPSSTYGLCKARVRELAAVAARRDGLRIDWFRPFTVYGPGQTGSMLVPSAFGAAAQRQPADFTDGTQERDFLFIDDLVAWIASGLFWAAPGEAAGRLEVHHLGTGVATPVRDVLARIAGFFPGSSFRLGALPRRSGEPDRQVALYRPAPWPWAPRFGIEDGLTATAAWWQARVAS